MNRASCSGWIAACVLSLIAPAMVSAKIIETRDRIEMDGGDVSETVSLSDEEIADVRKTNYLKYYGEGTYRFNVALPGWFSLWVGAAEWQTDLYLDDEFLLHTAFASGIWRQENGRHKVLNVYLSAGTHKLRFSHPWHAGLPYVHKIVLERSYGVPGSVRATPNVDHAVFRKGENFSLTLSAARFSDEYQLQVQVTAQNDPLRPVFQTVIVPAGTGNHTQLLSLPTDSEGVFTARITDMLKRPVDREIEYVVVDTTAPPATASAPVRELVQTILPASRQPDFSTHDSRISFSASTQVLESGESGQYENPGKASWFAYRLDLPSPSDHYLVETDYPDNTERTFAISVFQDNSAPYQLDSGVVTGSPYVSSGRIQTHQIYFHARQRDPRILVFNWHQGQRAAVSAIRVYRLSGPLPAAAASRGRQFGFYLEEPLRFPAYFGGNPADSGWNNLLVSATRYAEWTKFTGANAWYQTVAAYQATLWPARNLPGYGPDDEGGVGNGFPAALPSTKDFAQKDIIRLMLLVCEKYGIRFVPELQMYPNTYLQRILAKRFSSEGGRTSDLPAWLSAASDGRYGIEDPGTPLLNPVHSGVQEWAVSVVRELGERYKDSPAFQGVGLRLMGFAFGSWQAFASIQWGYDDATYRQFVRETGWPDDARFHGKDRFAERYRALTGAGYQQWIDWRVRRISGYHVQMARALRGIRQDYKLYLNSFGPHYSMGEFFGDERSVAERKRKGWYRMIRETGVDPRAYANNPAIVFSDAGWYPAGVRVARGNGTPLGVALHDYSEDPEPVQFASKPAASGTVSYARFYNEYLEADIPAEWLGLTNRKGPDGKTMAFRLCASINPAGRNLLSRYAEAMAAGNLVSIVDGGLGYFLNQPDLLRPFIQEYAALPAVGMTSIPGTPDGTAAWTSTAADGNYFYVVNRSSAAKTLRVNFSDAAEIRRLSTGSAVPGDTGNSIRIVLKPFELMTMQNRLKESRVTDLTMDRNDQRTR